MRKNKKTTQGSDNKLLFIWIWYELASGEFFRSCSLSLKRSFNQKLGEALSAQEEHSKNYDRLLAAQTSNYTNEIKTIANLAENFKNNDSRFQKVADKIVSLQELAWTQNPNDII